MPPLELELLDVKLFGFKPLKLLELGLLEGKDGEDIGDDEGKDESESDKEDDDEKEYDS
ncbi:hypothetical protein AGMMS49593_06240 [Endomicrobiia bacterium]|nr:hypothetical protein AGMMS49593_06240 [Endomicrobiia bacterium]